MTPELIDLIYLFLLIAVGIIGLLSLAVSLDI